MKIRIVILLLLISTCAVAQKFVVYGNDTINRVDPAGLRYGHWIIFGTNDKGYLPWQKFEEGEYLKNEKVGMWTRYYPSGQKQHECEYRKNRPYGKYSGWYENGHRQEEGCWKNNQWVGEYKSYWENDTLHQDFMSDSSGRRNGVSYLFFETGKLAYEGGYKDGAKEGWHREYYDDGTLKSETYYSKGAPDAAQSRQYPRETVTEGDVVREIPDPSRPAPQCASRHIEGTCVNGKLYDGKHYIRDTKGRLLRVDLYKAGVYVGEEPVLEGENK